jgi:bifunctional DNase/RNase
MSSKHGDDEKDKYNDDSSDDDYILASISDVGFVDPYGMEGALILRSKEGKVFHMRAFSGEVARHIERFRQGDKNSIPTIYNLVNEIAELEDLLLTEVRVYPSGSALRANLYFKGKNKNIVLRNYRASDSIALAAYYDIPIKVKKDLFYDELENESLR